MISAKVPVVVSVGGAKYDGLDTVVIIVNSSTLSGKATISSNAELDQVVPLTGICYTDSCVYSGTITRSNYGEALVGATVTITVVDDSRVHVTGVNVVLSVVLNSSPSPLTIYGIGMGTVQHTGS